MPNNFPDSSTLDSSELGDWTTADFDPFAVNRTLLPAARRYFSDFPHTSRIPWLTLSDFPAQPLQQRSLIIKIRNIHVSNIHT